MADFQQDAELPADFGGQQVPVQFGTIIKWGAVLLGLVLLFVVLNILRSVYTDLLWYDALGFRGVFVKVLTTRIVLFLVGALVIAILLGISLYVANRLSRGPVALPLPQEVADLLRKATFWVSLAAVIVISVIFGSILASRWEIFLRLANGVPFGETDPVFNKDISFYVFTLPAYTFLQGWLLGAAVVVLAGTLALYFANFYLRGLSFELTPWLKAHVSILGAIIIFVVAWGHWVDRWELVFSEQGAVFGAAYTDLNARKPALLILTIIAGASGVLMLVNAYLRGVRLLVGAVALWIVLAIALGAAWPRLMQQFTVNPNEFVKESPYIVRNIDFTRRGFGLSSVAEQAYPAERGLTAELISENLETIDNIRLWDRGPLSNVYRQKQLIRPYYDFGEADVDRYVVDGKYRQVMLAAREVAPEKLDPESQTWINLRLRYTHGFGVAMSPVTEFTPDGKPEFFAKDIPQDGVIPIGSGPSPDEPQLVVANPRIYYGENTVRYVIVNTNTDELDYQAGEEDEPRSIKYPGSGGVSLGSLLRRVAYAWQFGDVNILISGEITGDSLIQYRRQVQERISTVAPFLLLDQDPYIVAAEGPLFWIQDAYTFSDRYPYSEPFAFSVETSLNYMRNSVKVTVDAFDGVVRFYVWDPSDPVVATYRKIFPDLFVPKGSMPRSLERHVRYPQDLFFIQASKYLKYHMLEPQNFYNLADIWTIPEEKFGQSADLQAVEPYYVIMKIPGEERVEFVLLLPYTRNQPPIMAGWLVARNDGENYGKLLAFIFPKERQLDSPEQIEAKIDNDPYISQWLTLRCQEGSFCIRGNLLVIPLAAGDNFGLLYAEPIYLQAEGVEFPELKQVILATGERVVMEGSIPEAVASLTGFSPVATKARVDGEVSSTGETTGSPAAPTPATGSSAVRGEIENLMEAIQDIKERFSQLEEVLERLQGLTGGK